MSILAIGSVARTIRLAPTGKCIRRFSVLRTGSGHLSPRASIVSGRGVSAGKDQNPVDAIGRLGIVDRGDTGAGSSCAGQNRGIGRAVPPARKGFGKSVVAGAYPDGCNPRRQLGGGTGRGILSS